MSIVKDIQNRRKNIKEWEKEREQQILERKQYTAFNNKKKIAITILVIDIISILVFLWFLFYVLKI